MSNGKKWLKESIFCLAASGLTILIFILVFQLWNKDFSVPFIYNQDGDGLGAIYSIKNIIDGNCYFSDPNLNAPHKIDNYMQDYLLPLFMVKVLSIFCDNVGIVTNLFLILTYILTTLTTYMLLRKIHCNPYIAVMGGIIYSYLPYHYFRMYHFWLMGCYIIPLALWIIIDLLSDRFYDNIFQRKSRLILDCIFSIFIGLNGIYYAVFSVIFLFIAAIISTVRKKRFLPFLLGSILCGLIMLPIILLVLLPTYLWGGSQISELAASRSLYQMGLYALSIVLLFLPIPEHRIDFISQFSSNTYEAMGINTEGYMVSLGVFMSLGLIASVLYLLCGKKYKVELLSDLGKFNIIAMIIGATGGLNILIGLFVSTSIRCWNRISVFIALFSLVSMCLILQKLVLLYYKKRGKTQLKRLIVVSGCCVVMICAVLDQTTSAFGKYSEYKIETRTYDTTYSESEEDYKNLKMFVKEIEDNIGADSMIFQFPINSNDNTQFSQVKFALMSSSLKWSSSNVENAHVNWLNSLKSYNLEIILKILMIYEFDAILVDKSCYNDEADFNNLIQNLENLVDDKPLTDTNSEIYVFDLKNVKHKFMLENNLTQENLQKFQQEIDSVFLAGYQNIDNLLVNERRFEKTLLKKDSLLYGPYIHLEPGNYFIEIYGSDLERVAFSVTSDMGLSQIQSNILYQDNDKLVYEFNLDSAVDNVEFLLKNEYNDMDIYQIYLVEELNYVEDATISLELLKLLNS